MPRPPEAPCCGVWGMGARLCMSRVLKRCRSLSAAIFVVCLWLCLITMINLGFNRQQGNLELKEDAHLFIRSSGLAGYPALLGLSPIDKRMETSSSVKLEAKLVLRNELKASISDPQSPVKANGAGQKADLMENGMISGRRIQELKLSQMGGLESLSRRYEGDHRDGDTSQSMGSSVLMSSEQGEEIDTKTITVMEIRPDIQTPAKNLGDLQPNWTPEPEPWPRERVSHFSSPGIPQHEPSLAREESKPKTVVSSRAKTPVSESDRGDHKVRSEAFAMSGVMVKYGLQTQEKSINDHLPQSIGAMHNRQSNFYDGSSGAINKHLNGDGLHGALEREVNADPDSSEAHSIENSYHYLSDPRASSDGVTNTPSLRASRPKSNLKGSVTMQMKVPKRNKEFSPHNLNIDQDKRSPGTAQMKSGVKYPGHLDTLHHRPDKTHRNTSELAFIHTGQTINISHVQTRNGSNLTPSTNKLSPNIRKDGRGTTENVGAKQDKMSVKEKLVVVNSRSESAEVKKDKNQMSVEDSVEKPLSSGALKYDGFELYSYNVTASDAIALDREIPDTRPKECPQLPVYGNLSLPKTTVIICFHNEALSVLLRTVHSILHRTPPHILDKIVLVDDFSTLDDLGLTLEEKFQQFDKVLLIRTEKREGLVRARLLGSRFATSEVLVFLDAHCECNVGWLEPLLYSLTLNPHKVVSPYIDTIKAENFFYKQSPARLQGGFNWRLEFGWRAAFTRGNSRPKETQPILTPVISGGLFAVRKDYFTALGSYDSLLNIWGGENFELSFKTWMCGGSMEIVPCSRVGHVFRSSLPYTFTGGREETVLQNLARVASVWMDEYADIFYAAVDLPSDLDIGDISERVQLRKELGCQSFQWYLENVFPQMDIVAPGTVAYGQVRNKGSVMCLDVMKSASGYYLGLSACQGGKNQTLRLTSDHQLMQGDACIVPGLNKQLTLSLCTADVKWNLKNGDLHLNHSDLCMTSIDNELVHLLPCDHVHTSTVVLSSQQLKEKDFNNINRDVSSSKYLSHVPLSSNSFQQWTFDYSFNWKRRRRRTQA